jgi:hypothetical protein
VTARTQGRRTIWIDIENPPQVQYMLPFAAAFARRGADVLFTVRDDGITRELIRRHDVPFRVVGSTAGPSKLEKVKNLWARSSALVREIRAGERPDALLSPSRSATFAAFRLRIPSFAFSDYEYGNVSIYRLAGTNVFYPDVLDPAVLVQRGMKPEKLIRYSGLKEDVTFAGIDLDAVEPHRFPDSLANATKVLFRPPAEDSHYFKSESRTLALGVLEELARRKDVVVVYSPRVSRQIEYVEQLRWECEPFVLREPVAFLPLLKGVDAVVSGGGTMLREAAYLGVPAHSIFQGQIAAVDRYLESVGRLTIIDSVEMFRTLSFARGSRQPTLQSNPALIDDVTQAIFERLPTRRTGRAHVPAPG